MEFACASTLDAFRLVALLHSLARAGEEVSKLGDVVLFKRPRQISNRPGVTGA